eukprot:scaffold76901_cov43-Prasinocladus_malaysianus.AAC.1
MVCVGPDDPTWVVDKSPSYLNEPEAAHRAKIVSPNAKVLAVLCDPADRLWKEWWHNMRSSKNTGRCNAVDAFGRENVVAIDSGMLKTRRVETISKVLVSIGLDPDELEVARTTRWDMSSSALCPYFECICEMFFELGSNSGKEMQRTQAWLAAMTSSVTFTTRITHTCNAQNGKGAMRENES